MTSAEPQDQAGHGQFRHPAELGVGVVGSGRAWTALAVALRRAGHRIVAVSAVSAQSRHRIEQTLPGTPVREPQDVIARSDLVLLTVPDDVLPGLVAGLAATGTELAGCSRTLADGTAWRSWTRPSGWARSRSPCTRS